MEFNSNGFHNDEVFMTTPWFSSLDFLSLWRYMACPYSMSSIDRIVQHYQRRELLSNIHVIQVQAFFYIKTAYASFHMQQYYKVRRSRNLDLMFWQR